MPTTFNPIERRVLGVLIEKSMTQPEYYPMTLNAIVAGCNQKSNRDPEMELDEVSVGATLSDLRKRGLVEHIYPAPGARTDRFQHKIEAAFGWAARERAIMTELLLRGPQTVGELRTRCSRMAPFESIEIVSNVLDSLAQGESPVVAAMPREPGRSAIRYTHLLYPEDEAPATTPTPPPAITAAPVVRAAAPAVGSELQDLRQQVDALRSEVTDLRREFNELRQQQG